jgi:hypothetical protein|tara:strand:- start:717 stop:1085 length:369 start_codon:yes stop_codon:yes gene_type:complete
MANATALIPFSGSTQGQGVKVVATSTAGTLIHTTGTSATIIDRLSIWAYNGHSADVVLTIEFGGATVPDQNIVQTITTKTGLTLVVDGLILLGNGSAALTVKGFAATGNVIVLSGYVMRVTP